MRALGHHVRIVRCEALDFLGHGIAPADVGDLRPEPLAGQRSVTQHDVVCRRDEADTLP